MSNTKLFITAQFKGSIVPNMHNFTIPAYSTKNLFNRLTNRIHEYNLEVSKTLLSSNAIKLDTLELLWDSRNSQHNINYSLKAIREDGEELFFLVSSPIKEYGGFSSQDIEKCMEDLQKFAKYSYKWDSKLFKEITKTNLIP